MVLIRRDSCHGVLQPLGYQSVTSVLHLPPSGRSHEMEEFRLILLTSRCGLNILNGTNLVVVG